MGFVCLKLSRLKIDNKLLSILRRLHEEPRSNYSISSSLASCTAQEGCLHTTLDQGLFLKDVLKLKQENK